MRNKKPETFTVYEDLWSRGAPQVSQLCTRQGLCCLGFASLEGGASLEDIKHRAMPEEVFGSGWGVRHKARGIIGYKVASRRFGRASVINDSLSLTDDERKARLVKLFAEDGVKLVFKREAPQAFRRKFEELWAPQAFRRKLEALWTNES